LLLNELEESLLLPFESINYVATLKVNGFEVTGTRSTFMEMYEVPSGGDWSIHRSGAIFVQDAETVSVTNCLFNMTGGNGVFLSNHVQNSTIGHNEFTLTGDSAIASLGSTEGVDGTAPTYPNQNTIANNHIHDFGVYGKQTSCYFQAITVRCPPPLSNQLPRK
jgi:hypothetical protein